jgi:hypothetical protein
MYTVDEALHQLRVAAGSAAHTFYRCQRSYIRLSRDSVRRRSANAMQELNECLKAAEAYKGALNDLWGGLLDAAPFPGQEEEMRRTMARYEIAVSELHAIQMFVFGFSH